MRFGVVTPPVSGHLHPMGALGRELVARGHCVTVFHMADLADQVGREELEFWPIGERDHPRGSLPESLAQLAQRTGGAALRFTIAAVARTSEMFCRDLPQAVKAAGIDALIVDQMEPAGGAVADYLGLPFVTVCNALALNRDPVAPPAFTPWQYRETPLARVRNAVGHAVSDWMMQPITRVVAGYRAQWGLPPLRNADDSYSRLLQISQMPRGFDFPRSNLPDCFHYLGPLRRAQATTVPFPWERLNGRPLVYASLGTLQNRHLPVFQVFAEACEDLDVQLVLTHGGGLSADQTRSLPGQPLVVPYAPQLEVLSRATLTLTHAGLNTVLDSVSAGVPIVAVPLTYEQPAIARRVERAGIGRIVRREGLRAPRLRAEIERALGQSHYRMAARTLGESSRLSGGVAEAARLVESALNCRVLPVQPWKRELAPLSSP